jgi:hypothetical protein
MSGADVVRPTTMLRDQPTTVLPGHAPRLTLRSRTAPSSPMPDALLAMLLAVQIFYPVFTTRLHGSLTPVVALVLLVWINAVLEFKGHRYYRDVIVLIVAYTVFIIILARLVARLDGNAPAVTLERVVLLLPLAAAAGWMLVRTGRIVQYLSWFLLVGTLTVVPALFEYLTGRRALPFLFDVFSLNSAGYSASGFARNGHTRAVVGADHPLVLGALFLAMIPIAMYLGGRYRFGCVLALYAGIVTTGSNGPILVGALLLAVCFLPPLARAVLSTARPLLVLLAAIAAFLAVGSAWLWSAQIPGASTQAVSNQYRAALYYLFPRILHARPFGYGLDGLPPNTWYIYTSTSGVRDVSRSIDSELVYGTTQFGVLAVLVFVVIAVVGVRATVRNQAIGLSSLSTTLVGLFLAIHSWNSLGTFWFFGFGACAALVVRYHGGLDWRGLQRLRRVPPPQPGERELT